MSDKVGPIEWNEGQRIVQLGTLAHNLGKCTAEGCEAVHDLRNTVSEHRSGLGNVLWIRCSCGNVNKIQTSKSHMAKKYDVVFDVNTKEAAGMVHAGMTFKEVERFACNLEIPPPAETTLKRREWEIGPAIEKVGNATCKAAAALENELAVSAEDSEVGSRGDTNEDVIELTAGYDMGWQRRSSGRAYNSRSGHGVLAGKNSGKVLEYGSRVSNFKQCEVNSSTNIQKAHDCRMNWGGSAKAFERVKNENYHVSQLNCDDDATVIAKFQKHVSFDVTKQSSKACVI